MRISSDTVAMLEAIPTFLFWVWFSLAVMSASVYGIFGYTWWTVTEPQDLGRPLIIFALHWIPIFTGVFKIIVKS